MGTLQVFLLLTLIVGSLARPRRSRDLCPSDYCRCRLRDDDVTMNCEATSSGYLPHFAAVEATITLADLSAQNLTYIEDYSLSNLTIINLDLSNNLFYRSLPKYAFYGQRGSLQSLILSNCLLSELPLESLSSLSLLRILHLEDNYLTKLWPNSFSSNTHLLDLSLHRNRIREIDAHAFAGLSDLRQLTLFDNELTVLNKNMFVGLRKLSSLDISLNYIKRLKGGTFRHLHYLTWVDLSNNQMTSLPAAAFKGLRHLRYLNLANNPLLEVEEGVFQPTKGLRYLSLDVGQIADLNNNTLAGSDKLRSLNVGEVNRTSLPWQLLGDMHQLHYLGLWDTNHKLVNFTVDVFPEDFVFRQLNLWTAPVHDCTCKTSWIMSLVKKGAYIHGHCASGKPISCRRRDKVPGVLRRIKKHRVRWKKTKTE